MLFWLRRCEAFAARGCTVYASARRLESMSDFKHSTVTPVQLDVTKDEDVKRVIEMIIDQHGRIDVVVNNAGVLAISVCPFLFSDANVVVVDQCSLSGPLADIPMNQFVDAYDTNVFGPVRVAKAVIPHMAAKRSGTIVNIGSVVGEAYVFSLTSFHAHTLTRNPPSPTPWSGAYASTKASLKSLSEVLEMECAPFGICVMHVAPGAVKSNIATNNQAKFWLPPDSLYKGWIDAIIRRMHQSQEPGTTETGVFADWVVGAALKPRPPRYIIVGAKSWVWVVFRWLPRTWVLRFMWSYFAGKPKTNA